ncbi:hypothetical protein D3C77_484290 [compost metagenome]
MHQGCRFQHHQDRALAAFGDQLDNLIPRTASAERLCGEHQVDFVAAKNDQIFGNRPLGLGAFQGVCDIAQPSFHATHDLRARIFPRGKNRPALHRSQSLPVTSGANATALLDPVDALANAVGTSEFPRHSQRVNGLDHVNLGRVFRVQFVKRGWLGVEANCRSQAGYLGWHWYSRERPDGYRIEMCPSRVPVGQPGQ